MVHHHTGSPPSATISFPEMMLVLLKNLMVINFFIAKMSDLEAPTTNSGGRKARPYDGQVNPFGRGGVYPRPQRTDRSANPCIEIAQLGNNFKFPRE
jgi:hypothetical protein